MNKRKSVGLRPSAKARKEARSAQLKAEKAEKVRTGMLREVFRVTSITILLTCKLYSLHLGPMSLYLVSQASNACLLSYLLT